MTSAALRAPMLGLLAAATIACGDGRTPPPPPPPPAARAVAETTARKSDTAAAGTRVGLRVTEEFADMGAPVQTYMASERFRDAGDSLGLMHVSLDEAHQEVWLLVHQRQAPGWTVTRTLVTPDTLSSELRLFLGCERGGRRVPRLVSEAVWEDVDRLTTIRRAWEVDSSRQFVAVPTTGIVCHSGAVAD